MATGKLVDTWYYTAPGLTPEHTVDPENPSPTLVKSAKVQIQVRLVKDFEEDGPPQSPRSVRFEITCQAPEFRLDGTDIEALRVATWEKLDTHHTITWEPWYLVDLLPEHPYYGEGTGLLFQYTRVEKGTAWDGTLLMREFRHSSRERLSFWPNEFREKNGRILACIPGTPQYLQALEEFSRCIDELRTRLAGFLTPTRIHDTLLNLHTNPLLPHPSDPPDHVPPT